MAKFCTKCGTQLNDNARFCKSCGEKFDMPQAQEIPQTTAPVEQTTVIAGETKAVKSKSKFVVMGIVGVLVVATAVILCMVFSKPYVKPINKLCKAIENKDEKLMMECFCEAEQIYFADGKSDKASIEKEFKSSVNFVYNVLSKDDGMIVSYGLGDNIKINYEVIGDAKELDKDTIELIEEYLRLRFNDDKLDISKGYTMEIEFTVSGDKKDKDLSYELYVLKIDGKWCLTHHAEPDDDLQKRIDRIIENSKKTTVKKAAASKATSSAES